MEQLVRLGLGGFSPYDFSEVTDVPAKVAFVRVKEAAEILGVSPNTIRAWGAAGKIAEYRHPVNNYRLFKMKDLQSIVSKLHKSAPPRKPR